MKVVAMSKTTLDVVQYNNVTSISKAGTTITISYGTSSSVVYNSDNYIVRIMES